MSMWRPTIKSKPYDFLANAERQRLLAKWRLFQAHRRGDRPELIALHESNLAYYDLFLPKWRAERAHLEAQQARMLAAADACVTATESAVTAWRLAS